MKWSDSEKEYSGIRDFLIRGSFQFGRETAALKNEIYSFKKHPWIFDSR